MTRTGTLLLLCALAIAASGDDLRTPGQQVLDELAAALGRHDVATAAARLKEAAEIYRYPASAAEAKELLAALESAAKSTDTGIAAAALLALGRTGAPEAARSLQPFLALPRPDRALALPALEAAGSLHAPALVEPLLALAQRGGDLVLAERALAALGGYEATASAPRAVLAHKVLASAVSAHLHGGRRWERLRGPYLAALQRLWGIRLNRVVLFEDWARTQH